MILGSLSSHSLIANTTEPPLTATSLQRPFFRQTVHTLTFLSTSLQWPPSSVPKVTVIAGHLILHDGAISQN